MLANSPVFEVWPQHESNQKSNNMAVTPSFSGTLKESTLTQATLAKTHIHTYTNTLVAP